MTDGDKAPPPLKPSGHQIRQRTQAGGHDIDLDTAKKVVADPFKTDIQADGRIRFWGRIEGGLHPIRIVVSAAVSAGIGIYRYVTGHVDSGKHGAQMKTAPTVGTAGASIVPILLGKRFGDVTG